MTPVEKTDLAGRLRVLTQAVADLKRYAAAVTKEQLFAERDIQYMVLHAFFLATQATIDIALQACAARGMTTDGTYRDAFRVLAENGLLESTLAARLEGWAGFRNVVAHLYAGLDLGRVHAALSEVDDLSAFAGWAQRMLNAPGTS